MSRNFGWQDDDEFRVYVNAGSTVAGVAVCGICWYIDIGRWRLIWWLGRGYIHPNTGRWNPLLFHGREYFGSGDYDLIWCARRSFYDRYYDNI